jgi:SAM-dependent methyltransferase
MVVSVDFIMVADLTGTILARDSLKRRFDSVVFRFCKLTRRVDGMEGRTATEAAVLSRDHWEVQYRASGQPWETGRPSSELCQVLDEYRVRPCRAVELGCGTGSSAVWLARRGFAVTAVDLSPLAIHRARQRARGAGVSVNFLIADVTDPAALSGHFDFFFDCGCYHAVRLADGPGYLRVVARATRPGALGLVLMGNAAEPEDRVGPPVLDEWQVRAEWGRGFDILHLRPFRFDPRREGEKRYLGWSCWLRRASWAR